MSISRRRFLGLAAGAAAVRALPGPVLGLAVEPVAIGIEPDLPPAHMPKVGDMLFLHRDGVYCLPSVGSAFKLSSEWTVIDHGRWLNATPESAVLGIDRTRR